MWKGNLWGHPGFAGDDGDNGNGSDGSASATSSGKEASGKETTGSSQTLTSEPAVPGCIGPCRAREPGAEVREWVPPPRPSPAFQMAVAQPISDVALGAVFAHPFERLLGIAAGALSGAARALGFGAEAGTMAAKGIGARVEAVHGALDPIAAGRRTTAALDTVEGTRVIAAGGRDLSPAQRALMAPGEVAAKLPGAHAEVTALQHAAQNGLTPAQMAVSRTICPTCRAAIEQSGGQLTSPTTAIWPK